MSKVHVVRCNVFGWIYRCGIRVKAKCSIPSRGVHFILAVHPMMGVFLEHSLHCSISKHRERKSSIAAHETGGQ